MTPTKFILPLDQALPETSVDEDFNRKNTKEKKEEEKIKMEQLKTEKKEIMNHIALLKRKMADIEIQEEELTREVSIYFVRSKILSCFLEKC